MSGSKTAYGFAALAFLGAMIVSAPAAAQTAPTDPDALIDASQTPETGLALARQQMADTDLMGAAGTLERVLLIHPEAPAPRLVYASLLCRLDDRTGAEVEVGLMAGRPVPDDSWTEVTSACGPIARPAGSGRGESRR